MKLENFTKEQVELGEFPLIEILRESLFYPACGFDGNIILEVIRLEQNKNKS